MSVLSFLLLILLEEEAKCQKTNCIDVVFSPSSNGCNTFGNSKKRKQESEEEIVQCVIEDVFDGSNMADGQPSVVVEIETFDSNIPGILLLLLLIYTFNVSFET